jgi:hypothetical protein
MIPSGLAALLLVLALVPGWYYVRLTSRLRTRTKAAGVQELLEFVSVGALTIGAAVLVVVLLPHRWHPWTLDADRVDERRSNLCSRPCATGAGQS